MMPSQPRLWHTGTAMHCFQPPRHFLSEVFQQQCRHSARPARQLASLLWFLSFSFSLSHAYGICMFHSLYSIYRHMILSSPSLSQRWESEKAETLLIMKRLLDVMRHRYMTLGDFPHSHIFHKIFPYIKKEYICYILQHAQESHEKIYIVLPYGMMKLLPSPSPLSALNRQHREPSKMSAFPLLSFRGEKFYFPVYGEEYT